MTVSRGRSRATVPGAKHDGHATLSLMHSLTIDGFVFNCAAPVTPVAFAHAMARVVLDA